MRQAVGSGSRPGPARYASRLRAARLSGHLPRGWGLPGGRRTRRHPCSRPGTDQYWPTSASRCRSGLWSQSAGPVWTKKTAIRRVPTAAPRSDGLRLRFRTVAAPPGADISSCTLALQSDACWLPPDILNGLAGRCGEPSTASRPEWPPSGPRRAPSGATPAAAPSKRSAGRSRSCPGSPDGTPDCPYRFRPRARRRPRARETRPDGRRGAATSAAAGGPAPTGEWPHWRLSVE
jgi:hypothetical protein